MNVTHFSMLLSPYPLLSKAVFYFTSFDIPAVLLRAFFLFISSAQKTALFLPFYTLFSMLVPFPKHSKIKYSIGRKCFFLAYRNSIIALQYNKMRNIFLYSLLYYPLTACFYGPQKTAPFTIHIFKNPLIVMIQPNVTESQAAYDLHNILLLPYLCSILFFISSFHFL